MMGEALQKRQERKQKCEAQNAGIFFVLGLRKGKKGIHYKKRKARLIWIVRRRNEICGEPVRRL